MTQPSTSRTLFTIGHSTHPIDAFLDLLKMHGITAIGDVRSSPYSRYNPQYNRETLARSLESAGIRYVFLGTELGARRDEPECYENGKVRYDRVARSPLFRQGVERVKKGAESFRLALMCAEKDPITCHRTILVCRNMKAEFAALHHILEDGRLESLTATESRLLAIWDLPEIDLFRTREELIEEAYLLQGGQIGFTATEESP